MSIKIEDYVTSLELISSKDKNKFTFKDIISAIFHACYNMSLDTTYLNHNLWNLYYNEFLNDLKDQNNINWPKLIINRNDYNKRMDILPSKSYIISSNILTLLLRILYIEKYKRSYVYKSYNYYKILGYQISINKNIEDHTLTELFDLLKTYLDYYIKIYNTSNNFEHELALSILKQLIFY